jgi:hypothetical protein
LPGEIVGATARVVALSTAGALGSARTDAGPRVVVAGPIVGEAAAGEVAGVVAVDAVAAGATVSDDDEECELEHATMRVSRSAADSAHTAGGRGTGPDGTGRARDFRATPGYRDVVTFTTWLPVEAEADVWDLVPGAAEALRALYASLWTTGLDPALLDLCRARADAVVEGRTRDEPATLGEADRAALAFTEQYVLDPHGVTDAQAEELHRFFTAPQLAALTTALATFDALARVRTVLRSRSGTPASIDVSPT